MSVIDSLKINAYTAFFSIVKQIQGADKPMKSDAEGVHPPKMDNQKYNESFYFNFFNNKKDDISCFTWIGKLPNQKVVNGKHLFFVGREEGLVNFDYDVYPEHTNKFRSRGTYYEVIEPFKKIHIVSKGKALRFTKPSEVLDPESIYREKIFGLKNPYEMSASDLENLYREFEKNDNENFVPVEMNCIFTALSSPHNAKNRYARGLAKQMVENGFGIRDLKNLRKIASEHYEQAGSYKGTLKIGSRTIEIDAIGHRDHSWGIRDWHAPEKWTWLSVEFGDGVGLNLCRIVIGKVDMFLGYIIREGRNYPLKEHTLDTEFEPDGITQKKLHFCIEDVGGFRMNVTGQVFNVFHFTFKEDGKHTIVNEGLTEYSWEEKKSFGISEYLHRLS